MAGRVHNVDNQQCKAGERTMEGGAEVAGVARREAQAEHAVQGLPQQAGSLLHNGRVIGGEDPHMVPRLVGQA